jgi:hypothetical protein
MRQISTAALFAALAASSTAVGQQPGAAKAPVRTVKFAAGETTIGPASGGEQVVVRDKQGRVMSESWCEPGAFDAYRALFTKLKETVVKGDRRAVVKLCAYPLRVNAGKAVTYANAAALSKDYEKVFASQVVETVRRAEPAAVFCRNGRGMFGDGVVWAAVSAGRAKATVINR